jgi:hypothetical protein
VRDSPAYGARNVSMVMAGTGEALPGLCVPKTSSTLCDQVILVDQATDARPSSYAVPRKIGRLG